MDGAISCQHLPIDYPEQILNSFKDYTTFAATTDGEEVLAYDGTSEEELEGKTLAEVVIDDEDLHEDFNEDVVPLFEFEGEQLIEYEGDDGTVHLATSRVSIETSG